MKSIINFGRTRIFFCLVWGLVAKAILKQNYNSGQKSLGQNCNIHIFLSFPASLLKQCILFKIFVAVLLPPTLYKVKTRKKFWIHVSNIVCGVREGVGPVWIRKCPTMQIKCPILVFTKKTTQPHPQVFSVIGALTCRRLHVWCHFLVKHKIFPNLVISNWLWWIMHVLLANQNWGNIHSKQLQCMILFQKPNSCTHCLCLQIWYIFVILIMSFFFLIINYGTRCHLR